MIGRNCRLDFFGEVNIPACVLLATTLLLHQASSRFSADNGGDRQDCFPSSESVALDSGCRHPFFHLNPQKSKKIELAIFSHLDGFKKKRD